MMLVMLPPSQLPTCVILQRAISHPCVRGMCDADYAFTLRSILYDFTCSRQAHQERLSNYQVSQMRVTNT